MNNKRDDPNMKTAVSSFRFQRTTLKKRLDKYQVQHTKTLRDIVQNQKDLTRSLSLESEQSLDKHKILCSRTTRSLYATEPTGDSTGVECKDQHSVPTDPVMLHNKYDRKSELAFMLYPVKNQTNGKLSVSSFLPSKPRSASFGSKRFYSSAARSNSVAESKTSNKVLRRQERIENSKEKETPKSLIEQTKNMIISDQERSRRSTKVNKDALKDQKHDKHKMNLTEKSQQMTASKQSVNSLHEYEVKTAERKDKEKSFLNLFKNINPLPTVSKQNANSSKQAEANDNNPMKSVNDISRTILEPASFLMKQRLRPTKSLSPVGTRNTTAIKQRSKTFAGETENQGCYSENSLVRKQVDVETKDTNPKQQHLRRWHRNAWSEMDDNFTEKRLSTPKGETSTPSLQMSSRKQRSYNEEHISSCAVEEDETLCSLIEKKEIVMAESYELPTIDTECNGSKVDDILMCNLDDNQSKEIPKLKQRKETVLRSEVKDHVMHTTPTANQISEDKSANQISEDKSETDYHSPNKKDMVSGNGAEDNCDSRDKKAKGWRKLRAIPLTERLQEINDIREVERNLPVLQDFRGSDSRLPAAKPGLISFRQVVLEAIKKEEEERKKKRTHEGEILISRERMNEIQQPTESFLRQTVDKKIKHYTTHPTEERTKRGPEFHAVTKGIQGFQTLSNVVNTNRLLRAEKIRKKTTLPYTRTQEVMANRHKTISEMMEEVKNCRYLRNKEYVT